MQALVWPVDKSGSSLNCVDNVMQEDFPLCLRAFVVMSEHHDFTTEEQRHKDERDSGPSSTHRKQRRAIKAKAFF